jgi:hypothetical protein
MRVYKRNQVEQAISRVLEPGLESPTTELDTRIKRLLDTDRALGRLRRSSDPERANYAFYSAEPPGSGVEVWFSLYEAFALLNGLTLMRHGWPQGFAVSVMRRLRPELEAEHARILKQDVKDLFDKETIRRNAKPGDFAFDVTDPVLLVIVSRSGPVPHEQADPLACTVARGPKSAMEFWRAAPGGSGVITMFEVAAIAHKLAGTLELIEPSRRGRG